MLESHNYIGHHTIWDIYECNSDTCSFVDPIREILNKIVNELQLGKVDEAYKQFDPIGATGFILLEESHISIHTWPEKGYVAIDVFSCKPFNIETINTIIKEFFQTDLIETKVITRGNIAKIMVKRSI